MSSFMLKNYLPQEIIYGPTAVDQIGADRLGIKSKKILVITDRGLAATGNIKKVTDLLDQVDVYSDLTGEPTTDAVEDALGFCRQKDYDFIIGIGGGSALDTAKVVAALKNQSITVAKALGRDLLESRKVGLGLIPTTAGTGSEATPNSIFIDSTDGVKKAVISQELIPDWVILDPAMTVSLPATITASTGMDALCHCIESLLSVNANEISAAYSYQGVKLLSGNIRKVVENGNDLEARGNMLLGSFFGGLALTQAGTTAVHALSYPLGKRGVPHGVGNAMLLATVLKYNLSYCEEKMASLIPYMADSQSLRQASDILKHLDGYLKEFPLPKSLDEVGIKPELLSELAAEAMQQTRLMSNNPRQLNVDEVEDIYKQILHLQ